MGFNDTQTTMEIITNAGKEKAEAPNSTIFILSFMGGVFTALAGIGQVSVLQFEVPNISIYSRFLGASLFPIGLMFCVFLGGTLFTGNTLIMTNYLNKEITFKQLFNNLGLTWVGNFIGTITVSFIAYQGGIFKTPAIQEVVLSIVEGKLALPFVEVIFSAFLCNLLVVSGILFTVSATDAIGKIIGCWFVILLFVLSGYQHTVANMYYVSAAKIIAPESIDFTRSLYMHFLPVTFGNFLSGGVFFPFLIRKLYVKRKKQKNKKHKNDNL